MPEVVAVAVEVVAVEEVGFPEKVQQVEADFRLREDRRKVVREIEILNPSVALASKIRAASSTPKVLRTSKREALASRTARLV